jgi:hypothetical protein
MLPPSCLKDSVLGTYACLDHLATLVREIKVNCRFAQLACTGYYMTRFFQSLDALIQETHFGSSAQAISLTRSSESFGHDKY